MSKYGTSESFLVGSHGGQLKIIEETDEVCKDCEDSEGGPATFGVLRDSPTAVDLICTNCGISKTVFPNQVKRRPKPPEA